MRTFNDAKTMAKSLRGALENRNVSFSHSECLEIVAQQFGFADWNTLSAKLPAADAQPVPSRSPEFAAAAQNKLASSRQPETIQVVAPWSTCSFCGKSRDEVRIVMGGCGGWKGFLARRNPESGERSNVFICNECIALAAEIKASSNDAVHLE